MQVVQWLRSSAQRDRVMLNSVQRIWVERLSSRLKAGRLCGAVIILALAVGLEAREPKLVVSRAGSSLLVTFDLLPDRVDDLAVRLRGHDQVTVTWQVDVRREVAFWVDRGVQRFVLTTTARRAAGAEEYVIERALNRRKLGQPIVAPLGDTYRHLTSFTRIELPFAAPVTPGTPYRLAITARVEGVGYAAIVTTELARTVIDR